MHMSYRLCSVPAPFVPWVNMNHFIHSYISQFLHIWRVWLMWHFQQRLPIRNVLGIYSHDKKIGYSFHMLDLHNKFGSKELMLHYLRKSWHISTSCTIISFSVWPRGKMDLQHVESVKNVRFPVVTLNMSQVKCERFDPSIISICSPVRVCRGAEAHPGCHWM